MSTTATGSSTNRFMTITYDGGQMILDPIAFVVKHNITDTRDLCRWVLKIAHDREEVIGEIIKRLDKAKEERPDLFDSSTVAVLQDIGRSMYYKQIFEMQQRASAAFGFTPLDPDRLIGIINRRWSGQNFSERLWTNREQLAAEVKKQLLLGILTGRANRKMAQEIDGRFSVSYNNTRRLVRTEANYVANQLQVESYKDTGVDKYIYVAILDLRTSEICIELDKKRFLVSNAIVGENYPPMHPWCRSTTIAWMPDQLLKKLQQSAIDPATGETITVPGDMTYREWYDKYVRADREGEAALTAVGTLDPDKYRPAVHGKLRSNGVIITDKQIEHIDERRGEGFYEKYAAEFSETVRDPDIIFEDAKHDNSVLAVRKIDAEENRHLMLSMRLATTKDPEGYRSSVITAVRITDKRLARYLNANKIVYKKT